MDSKLINILLIVNHFKATKLPVHFKIQYLLHNRKSPIRIDTHPPFIWYDQSHKS